MAASNAGAAEHTKLVCFLLQGQEYAADIRWVKETLTLRPITQVALTPPWLAGIMNLRGDVVAVLDLAQFLGMAPTERGPQTRIVVATHEGKRVGLLCDALCDVRNLDVRSPQPAPATLDEGAAAMLAGIVTLSDDTPIRLLDLPALFQSSQLAAFRRGESS